MELLELDNEHDIKYNIQRVKERKRFKNIALDHRSMLPQKISDIFDILQWSEVEIARQLTLFSHQLLSKIEYNELLGARWTKSDKYQKAPNVMKAIVRFNKLSYWIAEEILSYDKKKMRAKCVEKFIKVAVECEKLGNFNDMVNILTTLENHIIKNLHKTWSKISSESFETLQRLSAICKYENNYSNLRAHMAKFIDETFVPYPVPLFMELAHLEEGPKYVKNEYLVNMTKITSVGKAIQNFMSSLITTYPFKQLEELNILIEINPRSEEEIEELANKIGKEINLNFTLEPKFTLRKTKSTQKRITNTDSKSYQLKPSINEFLCESNDNMADIIKIEDHF